MLECQKYQEIGPKFSFDFFEESLVLEYQKAQPGTKYHLLLVTETAEPR